MTRFDPRFFRKFEPTPGHISRYMSGAARDLVIAKEDRHLEVRLTYAYQALIRAGIALLAQAGPVKVRSVPGHHVKILETMSEILDDPDIAVIGNAMRTKRNLDLYEGEIRIGDAEVQEFIEFAARTLKAIRKFVEPK